MSSPRALPTALVLLVGALLVRTWVLVPYTVDGTSMEPSLVDGQTVVADRLGPALTGWHAGDVAVLRDPSGGTSVKRLVAGGRSTVAVADGQVLVDDRQADARLARADGLYFGPVAVPDGSWFVLGDAGAGSVDSRTYGSVPVEALVGRVVGGWGR